MNRPPIDIPAELLPAYEHCARVVQTRARNFYYGLRLTPEPRRSAIYSVYAWMRAADDEADAAIDIHAKRASLARFRAETEALLEGAPLRSRENDPAFQALRHTINAFEIEHADFRTLLDGLDFDLEHEAAAADLPASSAPVLMCRTRDELKTYCYRVASTVGLICIRIWGLAEDARWSEAKPLAVRRGLAFQLTNILRDYAQDFDEGRVYLPEDDFQTKGLSPHEVRTWARPAVCQSFVREIAGWARAEYAASAPLEAMIDPACFSTLRTMTRIYSGLLRVVEREPARIAGARRIRLQSLHKAGIALRACARGWVNIHIPRDSHLHTVLTPIGRR